MTFVPWEAGLGSSPLEDVRKLMEFLKEHKVTVSTSQTSFSTSQTSFEESWLHLAGLWDLTNGDLSARWLYPFYVTHDDNDNMIVEGGDKLSAFSQIIWMFKKLGLGPDCIWWSGTYSWPEDLSEDGEDEENEEDEEGEHHTFISSVPPAAPIQPVIHQYARRRVKRKTEVELLREDWRRLHFWKKRKYEPLVEEFGSTRSGDVRRSRRIYCGL